MALFGGYSFYRWVCRVFLDILRAGSPNAYHAIHDLECADWADSTRPSPYNPPKRIYHSVFLRVTKKVMAYHSIPLEEEGHFDEIAYKKKQGA